MIQPLPLRSGDVVALVSPSGPVPAARVDAAVAVLTGWGLQPKVYPHVLAQNGYLAGTDDERLSDLQSAFADPSVRAVWAARGGYGVQRILDRLDFAPLAADPKLVIGFSDITALHLALWQRIGLATVHGPVAAQLDKGADSVTARGVHPVLTTADPVTITADPAELSHGVRVPGRAEGFLMGGNLSLLAASVGTAELPSLAGAIVLIEEIEEAPYRVDRMLLHLHRSGVLDGIRGVALGQFTNCGDVLPALIQRVAALGVPVLGGLPIGHGDQHFAAPLGTPTILDTETGTLVIESACASLASRH